MSQFLRPCLSRLYHNFLPTASSSHTLKHNYSLASFLRSSIMWSLSVSFPVFCKHTVSDLKSLMRCFAYLHALIHCSVIYVFSQSAEFIIVTYRLSLTLMCSYIVSSQSVSPSFSLTPSQSLNLWARLEQ